MYLRFYAIILFPLIVFFAHLFICMPAQLLVTFPHIRAHKIEAKAIKFVSQIIASIWPSVCFIVFIFVFSLIHVLTVNLIVCSVCVLLCVVCKFHLINLIAIYDLSSIHI